MRFQLVYNNAKKCFSTVTLLCAVIWTGKHQHHSPPAPLAREVANAFERAATLRARGKFAVQTLRMCVA